MIYGAASLAEICHNKSCLWKLSHRLSRSLCHCLCFILNFSLVSETISKQQHEEGEKESGDASIYFQYFSLTMCVSTNMQIGCRVSLSRLLPGTSASQLTHLNYAKKKERERDDNELSFTFALTPLFLIVRPSSFTFMTITLSSLSLPRDEEGGGKNQLRQDGRRDVLELSRWWWWDAIETSRKWFRNFYPFPRDTQKERRGFRLKFPFNCVTKKVKSCTS